MEFKEVAHLYLGCECKVSESEYYESGTGKLVRIDLEDDQLVVSSNTLYDRTQYCVEADIDDVKPILSPLSSMAEEERKELWSVVFKNKRSPFNGQTQWIAKASTSSEPRWVMMQGVERVGIEMNGTVWADSDLSNFKHNQHEVTLWLLSKHFDLFNLIPEGKAIDATKK